MVILKFSTKWNGKSKLYIWFDIEWTNKRTNAHTKTKNTNWNICWTKNKIIRTKTMRKSWLANANGLCDDVFLCVCRMVERSVQCQSEHVVVALIQFKRHYERRNVLFLAQFFVYNHTILCSFCCLFFGRYEEVWKEKPCSDWSIDVTLHRSFLVCQFDRCYSLVCRCWQSH